MLSYWNQIHAQLAQGLWFVTPHNLRRPLYSLDPSPLSNFVTSPTPFYKKKTNYTSTALFVALFFDWMDGRTLFDVFLLDIMDQHMSRLGTLVSEKPCVLHTTRYQIYCGLTDNEVFFWYSDSISQTQITYNTHKRQETNPPI